MGKELLLVAETVSNEKGVAKEVVLEAIQVAIESATKKLSSEDIGVRVKLDHRTGEYETFRIWDVVADDEYEFPDRQYTLSQAQERSPNIEMGSIIEEPIPSVEFGRIAAQAARQVIFQKVREAERQLVVAEYEERIGQLVSGIVKKTTRDNIIIDLGGKAEAFMPRSELLPHEMFRPGDKIRAYLYEVSPQMRGAQLFVSRTHPNMLVQLFKIEVPEIGEGVIEIKAAAREPGNRAKIAVKTNDGRIDPIGACVGMRGARVQAVSSELGGERVDIVIWDDNPAQLVINAMAPAEITSIVVDEDSHTMDLAVEQDQLSQAIGKGGLNIRLATGLCGWVLNVMTQDDFDLKTQQESANTVTMFVEKLEIDAEVAEILALAGFSTLEEVAYVPREELALIEEFDDEIVDELRKRASDALLTQALTNEEGIENQVPGEDLLTMEGMNEDLALKLAHKGICSMDDLAELSIDDLVDIENMTEERAGQLIMTAREPWFNDA